ERARNGENRAVDPFRKLLDRVIDLQPEQLFTLRVHRINLTRELVLHEVVEQRRTQRALAIGGTDNRHRLGPQQPVDLLVSEAPLGHSISPCCGRSPSRLSKPRHSCESGDPERLNATREFPVAGFPLSWE